MPNKENLIHLSIVIPAYREEKRIGEILNAILLYQSKKEFEIEVIVVNDASPDCTSEIVASFFDKIRNLKLIEGEVNKGKGEAIKEGVMVANGEYILFADADNSTPIEQVDKLLECIKKYEVVIGSRYCKGGHFVKPQPLHRIVGSRFINSIIRSFVLPGIYDTQCGFKLFQCEAARKIFSRMTISRWSFDIEILAIARKMGYSIKEIGMKWYDNPHSTLHPIRDGLRMVSDIFKIRTNIRKGIYRTDSR